ncbi:MAG: hypothetical protein Q7R95_11555, partial [bacterium]|nr:hypothetical protein [bacterium]
KTIFQDMNKSSGFSKKPNQIWGTFNQIECKHLENRIVYYKHRNLKMKGKYIYEPYGKQCKKCNQIFFKK